MLVSLQLGQTGGSEQTGILSGPIMMHSTTADARAADLTHVQGIGTDGKASHPGQLAGQHLHQILKHRLARDVRLGLIEI